MRLSQIFLTTALCLTARTATAQSAAVDSSFDYAASYWRSRTTLVSSSGDSLVMTCGQVSSGVYGPIVDFIGREPWSAGAISLSTRTFGSFGSTEAEGRVAMRWADGSTDTWTANFVPTTMGRGANGTVSGARTATLKDGIGFVGKLAKTGRVGMTYTTDTWFRSVDFQLNEQQRAATKAVQDRCSKKFEGSQAQR